MHNFKENEIRTFSGIAMNVFEPTIEMISIEDIAHSLSMQCRFGGHLKKFYSVAEHCTNAVKLVPEEHRLAALLHDASEAYLLDMPSPIKCRMPEYKAIEKKLMEVIAYKFGFEYPLHPFVKNADVVLLHEEWSSLVMDFKVSAFRCGPQEWAEANFMWHFKQFKK